MPYHVGAKGSYGCAGYPAVKDDGTVMGCHKSRSAAAGQIYAINRSEGKIGKAMVKEGDMVMAPNDDEVYVGRVVHVMTDGMLGMPGSEYALAASPEEPAILIQLFEMEEGGLEETEYFIGMKASEVMAMPSLESNIGMDKSMDENMDEEDDEKDDMSKEYQGCGCPTCKKLNVSCENCPVCSDEMNKKSPCWEGYVQRGMKEKNGKMVPNCVPVTKFIFTCCSDNLEKREFSGATRERMAESGTAMPDGSFPIANAGDLRNAIQSVGRAKNYNAAKEHIIRRARALGLVDMLPDDWKPGVRKTMWGGSIFDLNPFVQ